jgi:type IV secretory pathway VirB3-like protein
MLLASTLVSQTDLPADQYGLNVGSTPEVLVTVTRIIIIFIQIPLHILSQATAST